MGSGWVGAMGEGWEGWARREKIMIKVTDGGSEK